MRNTAAQHQLHVAAIGMNQVQAGVALNVVGNPFSILRERGFKEFIWPDVEEPGDQSPGGEPGTGWMISWWQKPEPEPAQECIWNEFEDIWKIKDLWPNKTMNARLPAEKTFDKQRLIFDVLKTSRAAIYIFMSMFVAGCSLSVTSPVITTSPVVQTLPPGAVKTKPEFTPTFGTASVIGTASQISSNPGELLKSAVANLQNAVSFQLARHAITAYQIIDTIGGDRVVYGEFYTNYAVIRLPTLKVHTNYEDRYNPQADFVKYESYTYQENSKYFTRLVEASATSDVEEINLQSIEPFASDVYQTLVTYFEQVKFVTLNDGVAVYILDHPEWYRLKGAVGFADLGFLLNREDGEQLVKEYSAVHYPNVKTIRFTIYVAIDEQVITKIFVDNNDFMYSIWASVDRALIEQGEKPENLTRYEVMSVNGAEYLFSNYNQVQDFEIP